MELKCTCAFCLQGQEHPKTHHHFEGVSSILLVEESLDNKDYLRVHACITCGHITTHEANPLGIQVMKDRGWL